MPTFLSNVQNYLKVDLPRWISSAWVTFGRCRNAFFYSVLPNTLKARIFDEYMLPTLTYDSETWAFSKEIAKKIRNKL